MEKMIDLGRVSEETKGNAFNSTPIDPLNQKRTESGLKYNAAPKAQADGVKVMNRF